MSVWSSVAARLEPIVMPPEPFRPSRSLADWMMLAAMFIFLVILSHTQMTTANELKKLNERMGPAQLGVSPATAPPPTVSPPPYPVGVPYPPPNPAPYPPPPTAGSQPKYEYLVDFSHPKSDSGYQVNIGSIDGARQYGDFLNNKSNEGWELLDSEYDTSSRVVCTFRKIVS